MERVHLVLSAGGIRCLAYIGALERLAASYEYETVCTCSAGSFVGALLCSGVEPASMREQVLELDLRRLAGAVRFKGLRQVTRRVRHPFALYRLPGIQGVYDDLVGAGKRLGDLEPVMATAALDLSSGRVLTYSSETHPEMLVGEVLRIATAVPLMYPPHGLDRGSEIIDASLASQTPLWLATGLGDQRPVVVLRAQLHDGLPPRDRFDKWLAGVVQSGIASQDAYVLERSRRVKVYDITTPQTGLTFNLSRAQKQDLIQAGWDTVAEDEELQDERALVMRRRPRGDPDGRALLEGVWRQRAHVAAKGPPVAFISYAHEDRRYVERLRLRLTDIITAPDVSVRDNSYIPISAPWEDTLIDAIQRTRVAVLLVSSHFNHSDYIQSLELPLLRKVRADIVWVSLDGTLPPPQELTWQGFPADGRDLEERLAAAASAVLASF